MKCPSCGMILKQEEQHPIGMCVSFRQYHEELLDHRVREILADSYFENLKKTLVPEEEEHA